MMPGRPGRPNGLVRAVAAGGGGFAALGHESLSYGLPRAFAGCSTALGEGRDRHHTTTLQRHSTTIDLFSASPQLVESNFIFELSVRV